MGFGYGAAIGAQVGMPASRVVHITGDGSFHMNMNECCTAVSNELPVITVIMDNRVLGMVRQWQTLIYNKHYMATDPERKTDYVKVAEGFGASGYRAETPEQFREIFKKAMENKGPSWIACPIAKDEMVLPMIQAGMTAKDSITDIPVD
jgi:acetolactate synthase-1/2/3 large subunit